MIWHGQRSQHLFDERNVASVNVEAQLARRLLLMIS